MYNSIKEMVMQVNYELNTKINKILNDKKLSFEKAYIKDLDNILELYLERMKWFKEKEIKQWSKYLEHHPKEEFIDMINNSNYFILKENNEIIAGFELSTDSKYWKDEKAQAYYIYKLVIKVGYKNIGELIFEICKDISKNNNMNYLRLDCLKNNDKLNQIYNNHGFKFIKNGYEDYYSYSLRELKIDE